MTNLKKDSRGRVRFSHNCYRFEILGTKISAYHRFDKSEFRAGLMPVRFLNDSEFVVKFIKARSI